MKIKNNKCFSCKKKLCFKSDYCSNDWTILKKKIKPKFLSWFLPTHYFCSFECYNNKIRL